MLTIFLRRAALSTRARFPGASLPLARLRWRRLALACAGLLLSPPMHAAETGAESATQAVLAPLDGYQAWRDEPLEAWRAANDRVGEIGGWRTYLRESQADDDQGGADQGHQGHHGN